MVSTQIHDRYTNSDTLLNNVCETFNSAMLPARDKPVISVCEWMRLYLVDMYNDKRKAIMKDEAKYTPNATKLVEAAKRESSKSCRMSIHLWEGTISKAANMPRLMLLILTRYLLLIQMGSLRAFLAPTLFVPLRNSVGGTVEDYVDNLLRKPLLC